MVGFNDCWIGCSIVCDTSKSENFKDFTDSVSLIGSSTESDGNSFSIGGIISSGSDSFLDLSGK